MTLSQLESEIKRLREEHPELDDNTEIMMFESYKGPIGKLAVITYGESFLWLNGPAS
jgi:hypothetical protein